MEAFFHAASDYADRKGYDIIFVRDFKEFKLSKVEQDGQCMWCIVKLRDACGPYMAEIQQINRQTKGKNAQTEEAYLACISEAFTKAIIAAHKSRIGNTKLSIAA